MELFGAGGAFFTLRGKFFANEEGEGGTGVERGTARTHAMM